MTNYTIRAIIITALWPLCLALLPIVVACVFLLAFFDWLDTGNTYSFRDVRQAIIDTIAWPLRAWKHPIHIYKERKRREQLMEMEQAND